MDDINPAQKLQLDALAEEYGKRHGAAVNLIKSMVGEGEPYANSVARAVYSKLGAWAECIDLPFEFTGGTGDDIKRRFIATETVMNKLTHIRRLEKQAELNSYIREFGFFALYSRKGIIDEREVYVRQIRRRGAEERPSIVTHGSFRKDQLPLFFRMRVIIDPPNADLSWTSGAMFCLTGIGERHLFVDIPYGGDDVRDLSDLNDNITEH